MASPGRVIIAFATTLLLSALAPFGSGLGRAAPPPLLVIVSPPAGLGLPVGQHVGVRYRFTGETLAILELAVDGVVLNSDRAQLGQEVTQAWTPATPGPHQLRVRALAPNGAVVGSASLKVIGLPSGSRVRVSFEE